MPGSIQSIERAAAVLMLLARDPGRLGLGEVARSLQLPKGTAHGILRTLRRVGFVDQDPASGTYRVSPLLGELGSARLDPNELRARSMNWTDPLAARTGLSVRVSVPAAGQALVVHHVFRPDDTTQVVDTGTRLPAHATAAGKVLLAFTALGARAVAGELVGYTSRTLIGPAELQEELAGIRRLGYATELGEYRHDQASLAAPIHGYGGLVVAAVSVHGDLDNICAATGSVRPKTLARLRDCAASITGELNPARSTA